MFTTAPCGNGCVAIFANASATSFACTGCKSNRPPAGNTSTGNRASLINSSQLAPPRPSLHLVGRNGMHKYNNQDHAMMTAMLTAQNIILGERRYDVWNVNEDAEYGEAGLSGAQEALGSERMVPRKVA